MMKALDDHFYILFPIINCHLYFTTRTGNHHIIVSA